MRTTSSGGRSRTRRCWARYPENFLRILTDEGLLFDYRDEDARLIAENTVDVLGMNYYQPMRVKAKETPWDESRPFHPSKFYDDYDMPGKRMNPYRGWEIFPKSLYDIGMRIKTEYGNLPWIVSESGMGVQNEARFKGPDGVVQDDYRIDFIAEHLAWLSKAVAEGSNCQGYWLFASLDNCSPYNAFKNRYGLVEVDRAQNLARRLKKSAAWYRAASDAKLLRVQGDLSHASIGYRQQDHHLGGNAPAEVRRRSPEHARGLPLHRRPATRS